MSKQVTVYEVDSDRGTYWESDPFVPEIWDSEGIQFWCGRGRPPC